jgi:ABC-type transport system involved in multi-copper enzyme maturation permease subunit
VTRLLQSEIRRLAGRRLVKWLLLVSLALVAVLIVIVTANSNADALNDQDAMTLPQLWLSRTAAAAQHVKRDNAIATVSVLSYLLTVVIGASAVGAEYRAGTVTTILTWEPRRVRLLVARLAAAAVVAMVFFLLVQLVFVAGWALGVAINGRSGTNGDFWRDLAVLLGRATVIAGALAVISGAIATIGRNTAAAMGVWFGYLIAIEAILRGQVEVLIPWFLTPNVGALYGWESVTQNGYTVTGGEGALRLALYVVLFAVGAVVVFQRRDVT